MSETFNFYLDFDRKSESTRPYLVNLKKRYGKILFPGCPENGDLLDYYTELAFPEGLQGNFYISNTSLKESYLYLTIRPRIDNRPRLQEEFPSGLVLGIRGRPYPANHPQPLLTVTAITEMADSHILPYENEFSVLTYTRPENLHPRRLRKNSVLNQAHMEELPLISVTTRQNLQDWKNYLEWKKRITQSRLAGLRYLKVDREGGLLRFLVVAQNEEELSSFKRKAQKQHLMVFGTSYSKDAWFFSHNPRHQRKGRNLGNFVKAVRLDGIPSHYNGDTPSVKTSLYAHVYFRLSEDMYE